MTCDTLLALDGGAFPFRSSVREGPPLEESCFATRAILQPGMFCRLVQIHSVGKL